ncbi:MAG TPA: PIG-L family deacetylase, partial [Pyrinomonadaceae bacterium]|nr:PIG-L family deacetylase [Pyrinomonadaceae bacterium]
MKRRNSYQSFFSILCTLALFFSSFASITRAQVAAASSSPTAQTISKADLHQALIDLTNTWTVMCVAAHPDDEDGTTLTVLRRRDGVHTVSLFSTYGEGGQNAVGPELYEELGVIRAQETMNAAKIQGSEPYFLGLKDFGYSKSADEAFKIWGHDEALGRMVKKIRELRPDVIITNHNTTNGHGHHQATGRLIIEAFDAAADPKQFPEQLNRVKPWQAQRLFVRVFGSANAPKPDERLVSIDPNEIDPVRGTSFAEQALAALQQHATQGPWPKSLADMMRARRIEGGRLPAVRYRLVREASGARPLTEKANTPLAGLELPEAFAQKVTLPAIDGKPLTEFLDRQDRVLAALVDWRASQAVPAAAVEGGERFRLFESRADRALAVAAGISLTLSSRAPVLVPGGQVTFSINLANTGIGGAHLDGLQFSGWGENVRLKTADLLLPDTETIVTVDNSTPRNAVLTVPKEKHLYDGYFLGKRVSAKADLEIDGAKFSVNTETRLDVAPAVEIRKISPSPFVWTSGRTDQVLSITALVGNNLATPFRGTLELSSAGLGISAVGGNVALGANETRPMELKSNAAPFAKLANVTTIAELYPAPRNTRSQGSNITSNNVTLSVKDSAGTAVTRRNMPVIFSNARVVPGLSVGYIPSFDQTLEHSLAALGIKSKALTIDEIKTADLSVYNTVIIDNRGYEAHPELIEANARLLAFVEAGGTLLVFYHKDDEWNPDEKKGRPQLAPYPITLDDERVTDETAPITFLQPRHPLLSSPNKITQADFANWIQERGLYYPKQWDA